MADCVCSVTEIGLAVAMCWVADRERTIRDSAHVSAITTTTEATDTTVRATSSAITSDRTLTTGRHAVARDTPLLAFNSRSKTWGPAHRCRAEKTASDETPSAITLRTWSLRLRDRQDHRIASATTP